MSFANLPSDIKGCQHFMKLAEDHDNRDIVVAYYSRMAAIQLAMKIVPGAKPPEVSKYLMQIMDWLETTKKGNVEVEGITNETVAQALIEEYVIKLYEFGHKSDCDANFNKNMVKAYYTCSLLCEVLHQFGPLSEDLNTKCMTAKYRATYIHNMLKSGQEPTPINVTVLSNEEEERNYVLTREELNERRALRGEGPIEDEVPEPIDPAVLEQHRKMMEEVEKNEKGKIIAELEERRRQIDKEFDDNPPELHLFGVEHKIVIPDQIIDDMPTDNNYTYENPGMPGDDEPYVYNSPDPVSPALVTPSPTSPAAVSPDSNPIGISSSAIAELTPDQSEKAIKYCKWASSALNYDDIKTAVDNLEKALYLCRFGKEK